jgi:hypothetical protein
MWIMKLTNGSMKATLILIIGRTVILEQRPQYGLVLSRALPPPGV